MLTTETILDRLEALDRLATPAPWGEFCESGHWWIETEAPDGGPAGAVVCTNSGGNLWPEQVDLDCAIAARNALPALVRVVRAAQPCADDLAAEIQARYAGTLHHPAMLADYKRDMATVEALRAALAALEELPR